MASPEVGSSHSTQSKIRVLVGALIVQLILGTVYGYSIFWQPLQSQVFPPVITEVEKADLIEQIERAEAGATTDEVTKPAGVAESVPTLDDISRYTVVADDQARDAQLAKQNGYLKYAFSICILAFAFTMVVAGRVQDVTGPKFPAVVGAVMMGSGFLVAGFMDSPVVFYLAHAAFTGGMALVALMLFHALLGKMDPDENPLAKYMPYAILTTVIVAGLLIGNNLIGKGSAVDKVMLLWGTIGVLAGSGIGFAYVCPIAALVKWFPDHKGLVSGIAVAGFGFGAYLFKGKSTIGALGFIDQHGITNFYMVHGLICLVGVSLGASLLSNPPGSATKKEPAGGDSNWQDTLRQPSFYLVWLMFFSGAMAGLMVIGILKPFAGEQLVAAAGEVTASRKAELLAKGAAAVGWLAIFNAVGRVVWGFVSDRIGRTAAFVAMFTFQAVTMCVLSQMKSEVALAVAASIVGFNFGGNFALFPSATADLFGAKNLGANYGWVFTSYGVAGVIGVAAGNLAKVHTQSYSAAFILAGILCAISAGLAIVLSIVIRKHRHANPAAPAGG